MKKFLPAIVLFSVLAVLVAPAVLAADEPVQCCKMKRSVEVDGVTVAKDETVGAVGLATCQVTGAVPTKTNERWGIFCLINTINTIVDWLFAFLVIFAAFYVILGAWNILTSAGAPEKVTSGRNYILYAAIGLLVAFIARAIPALVKAIMGF